jgi:hypothetical protein
MIEGIALATIANDTAVTDRKRARRTSGPGPYIFFTARHQAAFIRARDLHIVGALPSDTLPSGYDPDFTTIAADPAGDYVAAGRDIGDLYVWKRVGLRYETIAVLKCDGRVIRVLLHVPPTRNDQAFYVYAAAHSNRPISTAGGDNCCDILSWRFPGNAPAVHIATTPSNDETDIALGSDRQIVLSAHRSRSPLSRYTKPPMYGMVRSHQHERGRPRTGYWTGYYEEFTDGVLSVAVTRDRMVAFARDDAGGVTRIEPKSVEPFE